MAGMPASSQPSGLGQASGDVAGVVAEHRHAVAVGEVRGDDQGAERAGGGRLAGLQVEQLGQARVHVVVQVGLAAGPARDRDDLGHAERVLDARHAEDLGGGPGQAGRQHLPADVDAPQREVVRGHAPAPGGGDQLGQVAGVGRQDRRPAVAVPGCPGRRRGGTTPMQPAPGMGQAARGGRQVGGGDRPGALADLHDVARPQVIADHRGQRAERRPQLQLVGRQPDLGRPPRGAGGAGGQLARHVGAPEVARPLDQVPLGGDRDRLQARDVELAGRDLGGGQPAA